jgi:hypothetical protein
VSKKTTPKFETREQYLREAAIRMNADLLQAKAAVALPEQWYVSVMEPAGKVIGRAWPASHDAHHIFVSAALVKPCDPFGVLATLVHEMIHIAVGIKEKHNKVFGAAARAIGLEGKLTATFASEELIKYLTVLDHELGGYPQVAPLERKLKPTRGGSRIKLVSSNIDGYYVYINPKTLEEHGAPCDPEGDEMVAE